MEDFRMLNYRFIFEQIKEDAVPLWGKMSFQHVLEHLTHSLMISDGKIPLKMPNIPAQTFDHLRKFLTGKNEFPQGFKSPLIGEELPVLMNATLKDAINIFIEEVNYYTNFTDDNEKKNKVVLFYNPTFGMLNGEQWITFHNKHFKHHFKQFNLTNIL